MKSLLLLILTLAGLSQAQIEYDGGRTTLVDTVRWGDSNDSASYLLMRGQSKFRDSLGTWRALSGIDSCSKPIVMSSGTIYPKYKPELSYEVRGSSGNTDSTQAKLRMDSRYCRSATDTNTCSPWVPAGRFRGDTSTFVMDSLITVATTSGTTWKPTKQLFDVPGGSQIRMCADGFKTGTSATDSTFFRRLVVRLSSVPSGGIPPSAVSISGVSLGTVDVSSSALPTGAATSANQTNGNQVTQLVDSAGSKIGSTSHAINVNITGGAASGAVAQGSTTSGQTGGLTQAAVSTAAPTYTTGQTNPLSMTPGGALRVDASAASLTVGTHAVTQSGTWNDRMQDGSGNALASSATTPGGTEQALITRNIPSGTQAVSGTVTANAGTGTMAVSAAALPLPSGAATSSNQSTTNTTLSAISGQLPAALDGSGNFKVSIQSGGGTGGTASSYGAAFPATGTAVGFLNSAGTNMAAGNLDASGYLKVNVAAGGGAGGTSATDASAFTAGSSSLTPSGGLYQVTQTSNPLTTGQQGAFQETRFRALHVNLRDSTGAVLGNATTPIQVSLANTASNGTAVKVDNSAVTQPVSGTVTANVGTTNGLALDATLGRAQGSTTSGQTGPIVQGAVTTAAPTYTTAQTSPLSLTTAGSLRVDNSANTQPVSGTVTANAAQSGTWTVQPGNTANTTAWKVDNSAVNQPTVGAAAHGASVSGNPILNGFEARTSDGTAVTNGQAVRAMATVDGKQVSMPYAIQGSRWSSAAASGGIVNTTGVTIKAAAGAGIRNCVTSIDIENGHATVSTEVVLRDGASGTVIKRWWAQAAGGGIAKQLPVPLCGTANTLLEVAAITTGSAIYVNAEGYTSAE